ncbi:MAG TPA: DUF1697 domain-containing protein [Gemmatimonadaceae bacterium]
MRYVALLRAINVGGHVVKMDRLRLIFESMRFANVETFIASGNVLFDTRAGDRAALERRIERRLEKELGYEVLTFLRTGAELAEACTSHPFQDLEGTALSIAFLKTAPVADAVDRVLRLATPDDLLHLRARELYWLRRGNPLESNIWRTPIEKVVGTPATMRNVTTVSKLAAKLGPE